jgi:hypothetical protein
LAATLCGSCLCPRLGDRAICGHGKPLVIDTCRARSLATCATELAQWQQEFQDEKRRKPLFHAPAPTPIIKQASAPRSEPRMSPVLKSEERVGRNDPCPCGSGKKFKKCCINKRQMF